MVDLLDRNTQTPGRDADIDDPLAELARIIGYERPTDRQPAADEASQSTEFDLEAELMRELDVPQIPGIDDFGMLEADRAVDGLERAAGPDTDYSRPDSGSPDAADYPLETDRPWLEPAPADLQAWEPVEDLPVQDYSPAFADGAEPEAFSEVEPVSEEDPADPWAASDLDAEFEPDVYDTPVVSEPAGNAPGQVIRAEFGNSPTTAPGAIADDDVLADMFRFELPSRQSAVPHAPSASVMPTIPSEAPRVASWQQPPIEQAPTAFAASPEPLAASSAVERPNAPALDFEDFLSTELEAFEQNLSMGGSVANQGRSDDVFDASGNTGPDAEHDAWTDQSAEADWVFDEAAEELLADSADNDPMPARNEGSADSPESWHETWPDAAIEDAVAEELGEELGDPVAEPDQLYDPFRTQPEIDDLEFDLDLDQVLADTAEELGSDWTEQGDWTEQEVTKPQATPHEHPAQAQAWQAAPDEMTPDEMSEAFLGLVPVDEAQSRETAPARDRSAGADQPVQAAGAPGDDDWLGAFETSETAQHAGQDDFYFDAQLISEPEVTVEAVADIDVPELVHDEPQFVEPDYDTEIEREFASIVDVSDAETNAAAGTDHTMTEDWGRTDTAARYEVSDDYIALERELGVTQPHYPYQDPEARSERAAYAAPERDAAAAEPAPRGQGSRGSVLALAVLGVAVLAGAGALGWSMLSGDDTVADGGPRIIRADTEPMKVLPENPGGVTVPNQDKAVYDRVAGSDANSPGLPSLVNTAEEPVDVVQRTLDPEVLPLEGREAEAAKSEERLAADAAGAEGAGETASAPVVSPRRVRTMIVRPDGSIVAREEPEPEPQATAVLAEPTATEALTAEPTTAEAAPTPELAPATAPVEQAAVDPASTPNAAVDATAAEQSIAPVRVVTTQPVRAPVPQTRPADQPVTVVGTVTQAGDVANPQAVATAPTQPQEVAAAPVAAAPAAAAPADAAPAANPGGFYVQIASQPTAEGAQASWQTLSSRYNSIIGGRGVDIQRADIPGKGVFHRVRVPAGSRDEANALCASYKSAGGSCFVSR